MNTQFTIFRKCQLTTQINTNHMSWKKIPTSTIFNLKKLKKNVILLIPTLPCCCIPRQLRGFGQILYGYKFTQPTYDLVSRWVFSY